MREKCKRFSIPQGDLNEAKSLSTIEKLERGYSLQNPEVRTLHPDNRPTRFGLRRISEARNGSNVIVRIETRT
jgi:hypothetical protein